MCTCLHFALILQYLLVQHWRVWNDCNFATDGLRNPRPGFCTRHTLGGHLVAQLLHGSTLG